MKRKVWTENMIYYSESTKYINKWAPPRKGSRVVWGYENRIIKLGAPAAGNWTGAEFGGRVELGGHSWITRDYFL